MTTLTILSALQLRAASHTRELNCSYSSVISNRPAARFPPDLVASACADAFPRRRHRKDGRPFLRKCHFRSQIIRPALRTPRAPMSQWHIYSYAPDPHRRCLAEPMTRSPRGRATHKNCLREQFRFSQSKAPISPISWPFAPIGKSNISNVLSSPFPPRLVCLFELQRKRLYNGLIGKTHFFQCPTRFGRKCQSCVPIRLRPMPRGRSLSQRVAPRKP